MIRSLLSLLLFAVIPTAALAKPPKNTTATETKNLTWSHDIAPILYGHCTTCHHPGGAGPFSLLTYADAKRRASQIVEVTQSHFMPPWLPEPGYGDFADNRRLSNGDVAKLKQWFQAGMPQGDLSEAPTAPAYDAKWQLGKPDLVLKQGEPFTLPAGGTDVFRNFVFPYPLKTSHYIRAMEIRPGAPQVVHHANILIDRMESFREQHPDEWRAGVPGMEILLDSGNTFDPDSHFLFWKPDTPAIIEPQGMPWRLDPGNDLILNTHLKPSGKSETIDSEIGLYFTDIPPDKQPMLLQLDADDKLDIPAGDNHFVVEDSLRLPVDVEVLGIYPHAHYLGKDMQGWAILPDGRKEWLIWIRDWDIDRQSVYRYKQPLELPRGTVLHMKYLYDNSASNPRNPHDPPIRVREGNRSEDEMAHMWLQVLLVHTKPGDPDPRLQLEEAWMRDRLTRTPNDRVSLYNLGAALAGQGKYKEAAAIYEQDSKLHPNDARVLTAFGAALDGEGNWQQARALLQQAASATEASRAQHCDAAFDLADLDARRSQANAEQEFREELASCPDDAEGHASLGSLLLAGGQTQEAESELQRSLAINANNLDAQLALADAQLSAGDATHAMRLLQTAIQAHPSSADAHTQLARAYGISGDLNNAETELNRAAVLKPDDASIHSALSQVMAQNGNLDGAITEQQQALKLFAQDADGWNNLGVLEARKGDSASARKDFERALAIQPDHAQARANLAHLAAQ
ncbi:tetratricopeptide repeat protein [Acidicapsa dinghuensis]|uniref:Tetratricopeptide repeat protein n=1 Tax=Acidicapsa dinghuensis TaxID=2218256 RepID=A0ABW1EIE3_9BACT|nr:tetratricopeptide repeat protein [Acidicapsa dinghuensis]